MSELIQDMCLEAICCTVCMMSSYMLQDFSNYIQTVLHKVFFLLLQLLMLDAIFSKQLSCWTSTMSRALLLASYLTKSELGPEALGPNGCPTLQTGSSILVSPFMSHTW